MCDGRADSQEVAEEILVEGSWRANSRSVHRLPSAPFRPPHLIHRGHDARPHGAPLDVAHGAKLVNPIAGAIDREGAPMMASGYTYVTSWPPSPALPFGSPGQRAPASFSISSSFSSPLAPHPFTPSGTSGRKCS